MAPLRRGTMGLARRALALLRLIGAHDLWIASTAIANGFNIATHNNTHLARVPGLHIITSPN